MPTIWRFGGWRVVIYPNDHRPPHVHVMGKDGEAVFELNCPTGPVVVRENYRCTRLEISRIRRELEREPGGLCQEWEKIHGID